MPRDRNEWVDLFNRLEEGDRLALLEVGRFATQILRRARAFDFEDEWEDLVQEVLLATVQAIRKEKIRDPAALGGYVATITRNLLSDRLRTHIQFGANRNLPWDDVHVAPLLNELEADTGEADLEVRQVLDALPTPLGEILLRVKGHGRTCEQVASDMDIPLGTLKRKLSEAMRRVRTVLEDQRPTEEP